MTLRKVMRVFGTLLLIFGGGAILHLLLPGPLPGIITAMIWVAYMALLAHDGFYP